MGLSAGTAISLISLIVMCVPGLWFLIRNRHALLRTWNPQCQRIHFIFSRFSCACLLSFLPCLHRSTSLQVRTVLLISTSTTTDANLFSHTTDAYQREDEEHNDYDAPRSHFRDIENRNIVPRIYPTVGGLAERRQRILLSLDLQFQSLTPDSSQLPHTHNVSSRTTPPGMIENSSSVCVGA